MLLRCSFFFAGKIAFLFSVLIVRSHHLQCIRTALEAEVSPAVTVGGGKGKGDTSSGGGGGDGGGGGKCTVGNCGILLLTFMK